MSVESARAGARRGRRYEGRGHRRPGMRRQRPEIDWPIAELDLRGLLEKDVGEGIVPNHLLPQLAHVPSRDVFPATP